MYYTRFLLAHLMPNFLCDKELSIFCSLAYLANLDCYQYLQGY